jgi:hypothetical protein
MTNTSSATKWNDTTHAHTARSMTPAHRPSSVPGDRSRFATTVMTPASQYTSTTVTLASSCFDTIRPYSRARKSSPQHMAAVKRADTHPSATTATKEFHAHRLEAARRRQPRFAAIDTRRGFHRSCAKASGFVWTAPMMTASLNTPRKRASTATVQGPIRDVAPGT